METQAIERMYVKLNVNGMILGFADKKDEGIFVQITDDEYNELCEVYNRMQNCDVYFNEFGELNNRINY